MGVWKCSGNRSRTAGSSVNNNLRETVLRQNSFLVKKQILLTAICFTVWVLFIDDRDFITTHFRHVHELHKLEARKLYFEEQIRTVSKELDQLKSNPAALEKYAREKYLMKRDNEDLFLR